MIGIHLLDVALSMEPLKPIATTMKAYLDSRRPTPGKPFTGTSGLSALMAKLYGVIHNKSKRLGILYPPCWELYILLSIAHLDVRGVAHKIQTG
jgi:hypothetical protein